MSVETVPVSKAPKRPAGVHAKAWWDEADSEWVFGPLVEGQKHGDFTFWRGDGTRCNEVRMEHDVPVGPFKRFHESGEVSQEGAFDARGQLHGTRRWISTDAETTENTRPPGVSDAVWTSEMDYEHGKVVGIRHFNREGERVLPTTGEAYPVRPESVDEAAEFVEPKNEWHLGQADGTSRHKTGQWRVWNRDGALLEEAQWSADERNGLATVHVVGESPFADARVVLERGMFRDGRRTGVWELVDGEGATVIRVQYGDTTGLDVPRLQAYSNDSRFDYAALARQLEDDGNLIEALVTWARHAGISRDASGFEALRIRISRPLKAAAAMKLALALERPTNWIGYELVEGANPALVLQKIAIALDQAQQSRASLDFINAAILLAPEKTELLWTRGLVLLSLGLKTQAERDANELAAQSPDKAELLLLMLRGSFPSWAFTPNEEPPQTSFEDVPEAPVRTLPEVQALAAKYATRLQAARTKLLERLSENNVDLPPDLKALLPDGPVELEVGAADLEDEEGDVTQVDFDERPDFHDADIAQLLRFARADWSALSWLCWAAGETEVTLPTKLEAPENFGLAAGMAQQRLWRARDQRAFSGRNAKAHDVASFEWEGADMAELPPHLAGIAEDQYAEMQALFYWLIDPRLKTPWQDNLRGS